MSETIITIGILASATVACIIGLITITFREKKMKKKPTYYSAVGNWLSTSCVGKEGEAGMTNEDAIKWLENLKNDMGNPHYECLWSYAQAIEEICTLIKEQESVIEALKSDLDETLAELITQKNSYEKRLKARDTEIDMLRRFLASLSFYHKSKEYQFISDRAKACTCGKHPVILPYVLDSTCWVAQCKNCASRTVEASSPLQAVRYWNEDNLTEDSKLMRKSLDLDRGGADHLAAALKKGAIKDLLWAERTGHLDSKIAEEARQWLRDPKLIEDIESGAMRKRMEAMNEAEKKELEDDLH